MKKLLLILIPFLFISCKTYDATYKIHNISDYDVEIELEENTYLSKSNTDMKIYGSLYEDVKLKSKLPVKLTRSNILITISNNYTLPPVPYKLHVRNSTSSDITFKIDDYPSAKTYTINANSDDDIDVNKIPSVLETSNNFYQLNKTDGEYYLVFF